MKMRMRLTSNYWGRQTIMAIDYQLARDMKMVDIGPQWIYDCVDMIVYVISVVEELHDP